MVIAEEKNLADTKKKGRQFSKTLTNKKMMLKLEDPNKISRTWFTTIRIDKTKPIFGQFTNKKYLE